MDVEKIEKPMEMIIRKSKINAAFLSRKWCLLGLNSRNWLNATGEHTYYNNGECNGWSDKILFEIQALSSNSKTNNNKIGICEKKYLNKIQWNVLLLSYHKKLMRTPCYLQIDSYQLPALTVNFVARIKIYMCKKLVVIWWVYVRCSNKWNYCSQLNYINAQLNLTHFVTMALNARLYTQKRKNVYYTQNR